MGRDEQEIRKLAYELWEARGRPVGTPEADWYAAEQRLAGHGVESKVLDESVKESFPASDPPAPPMPDTPPANADEKWAAAEAAKPAKRRKRSSTKAAQAETEAPVRPRSTRTPRDANP